MSLPLYIQRDVQGYPTTGSRTVRTSPQFTQTVLLGANTVQAVTVPSIDLSKKMAAYFSFSSGTNVFFCPTASPTLTLPSTLALSTNELLQNGEGRVVAAGQSIQLLCATASYVTISYYEVL